MLRYLTLLLTALALVAAGCGGDDDDGPLTQEELGERASEICDDGEKELEDVDRPTERSEIVPYLEKLKEVAERATGRMRELEPPDDARAKWDDFVANYGAGSQELSEVIRRVEAGDQRALVGFEERIQGLARRERDLARELGATGCTN